MFSLAWCRTTETPPGLTISLFTKIIKSSSHCETFAKIGVFLFSNKPREFT